MTEQVFELRDWRALDAAALGYMPALIDGLRLRLGVPKRAFAESEHPPLAATQDARPKRAAKLRVS